MSKVRIGCDTVHIPRFTSVMTRTPATRERLFLPEEENDASWESLAGIFALKEAVMKALELQPGCWQDIQVVKHGNGRPEVILDDLDFYWNITSQDVSISHDGDQAFAVAIFLVE
ncbi:4'-phosphopantetheinyl transferase superfamily protein [Patescibacteria group bacterium]|nr:4'-phosphopantetheinyl transferase superfamily protein [Patescibacteria group bacterium]